MSNGVHPRTPPPPDSGTQPRVHHCTERPRGDGTVSGCPLWPDCLFADSRASLQQAWTESVDAERARHAARVATHTPTPMLKGFVEMLFWTAGAALLIGFLWAVLA
jgi:hypothetical protein